MYLYGFICFMRFCVAKLKQKDSATRTIFCTIFTSLIILDMFRKLLLIACFVTGFVNAQFIDVGVEGGPAMTGLWGNKTIEGKDTLSLFKYKQNAAGTVGLFVKISPLKWLSAKTGVYYDRINYSGIARFDGQDGHVYYTSLQQQLDYLNFPVMAVFQLKRSFTYSFLTGVTFGYLLAANELMKNNLMGQEYSHRTPVIDEYRRFNVTANFGIGIEYTFMSFIKVGLDIRNQLGVYNVSSLTPYTDKVVRTNSLQFLLRVTIPVL